MKDLGLSAAYLAAGGDNMPPLVARRFFAEREKSLKARIRALPLPEKFRLAAHAIELKAPKLALSVARLAVRELEAHEFVANMKAAGL